MSIYELLLLQVVHVPCLVTLSLVDLPRVSGGYRYLEDRSVCYPIKFHKKCQLKVKGQGQMLEFLNFYLKSGVFPLLNGMIVVLFHYV